jgi:hypothetical protein
MSKKEKHILKTHQTWEWQLNFFFNFSFFRW